MSTISITLGQSPVQQVPQQAPADPLPLPLPPYGPPQVPPPGSDMPQWPMPPSMPGPKPGEPPTHGRLPGPGPVPRPPSTPPGHEPPSFPPPGSEPGDGDGFDAKPWLIGAGVLGAGVAGALAIRSGARNVRALQATANAFESGAMHQGGLQSISDARLGARFAKGIGTLDYVQVATPIVNRVGSGGRLTAVARGHLDHAELLASATAMRRVTSDGGVRVHEPLRRHVLTELVDGRSMRSVLDDLDRSAAGAKPAFDNPQLTRYWDRTSIVERGPRAGGAHVTSGVSADRAQLAIRDGAIVETGARVRVNQLLAGRGADLDGRGLAEGIGTIQGVNVSTLPPAMQARAVEAAKVDPDLVEAIGLNGAFTQRWRDRLAMGTASAG